VPVPQSEATVVAGRCDFCYEDHPAWLIPARDFEVLPGHFSGGDWAACDGCMALIEANSWSGLLRRAKSGWESRHGAMPTEVSSSLPRLYRLLRKNISGSPVPNVAPIGATSAKFGQGFKSTRT
jgi:hypothetical protein